MYYAPVSPRIWVSVHEPMLSQLSLTRSFFINSTPTGLDCNAFANGNAGCGVQTTVQNNYGPAFNNNGGGW